MEERTPTEIQIQGEIYKTLWHDHEEARRCLFHVPNESAYDDGQQASSGVIPGIVDLIFVWRGVTWYIELKDDTGRVSSAQKTIHSLWKVQGYDTYLFYEAKGCIEFIKEIIAGTINVADWAGRISPHSVAEKYPEYLETYKRELREARARKAERSKGRVWLKKKKY